ncbi:bifunctional lysylphosphatidylglycerol flippase/synthetase MprF [Kineococcus gynurae]|uniref:Phosphatidylglycerol lysyltransferase n=1 Tax=Kineococcus gynurae TaxID=452979 RepID=A0ABV5LUL8_9ACTN
MSSAPSRPRVPVKQLLTPLLVVGMLVAAAVLLFRTFRHLSLADLGADLVALGPGVVLAALAATVASYVAMTGYDALALRYVEHPLPYRRFGLASFVATAFGNNLGASAVVGAALRARVYSTWQVPGFAITRIIGFNLVTLTLGAAVLAGAGLVLTPERAGDALRLSPGATLGLGVVVLAAVAAYLGWTLVGRRPLGFRGWRIDRPSPRLALAQVALSTVEWMTMAAVLHVLLPEPGRLPFLAFATAFTIATVVGLVSNVPGGLGVFETALVVLIGSGTPSAGLAVALVAYRLCYYVLPLLLATVLLVGHEARHGLGSRSESIRRGPARLPSVLTPSVLGLGVAGVGAVMLVAGHLPGTRGLDLSSITIGLAGLAALPLAHGLHRRLKGAWAATLGLLGLVTIVAAGHGDVAIALVTAGSAGLLLLARPAFYRGVLLTWPRDRVSPVVAVVLVGVSLWWLELSGLCAPGDRPLWAASIAAQTSGPDRLAILAGIVGIVVGGRWIVSPRARTAPTTDGEQLARVDDIVARSGRCLSHLAFTGDKQFHFSPTGGAFLMYQVEGRSWVVMGDPVGEPDDFRDLVWSFVDEVDRHGGRPVFYNVMADHAELYRSCGLSLAKLGEEAVVHLEPFSLAGKARMGLRNCRNKSQKLGLTVDFVPASDVDPLLPELREVSAAWLEHRNGKEKRFSLGAFDDEYVRRFPLIVVRQEGRVIAFATLWIDADDREVQVDIMRRLPDGPRTVMTYLFVECILWAKENGFSAFNLGMAPLSGLRTDATAPFWDRIGNLLWKHGEQFYNFKGLRTFKQGFDPEWRTCYVAAPGGPALPTAMMNVATLVGGGIRGVVRG